MNPLLYIIAGVVLWATGTSLQAYGSAKADDELPQKAKRRYMALAAGPLLIASSVFLLWKGQQLLSQQDAAKPVFEAFVDTRKVLHIQNLGTIDLEDVRVDATSYVLSAIPSSEGGGHLSVSGIESFSRPSSPLCTGISIPKAGGAFTVDLASASRAPLLSIHEGILDLNTEAGRTVYALRILCRNAVTKQRLLRYVITGAFKGFPDLYGDYRDAAFGGGFDASKSVFGVRQLVRSHQQELFDDDPSAIYHD